MPNLDIIIIIVLFLLSCWRQSQHEKANFSSVCLGNLIFIIVLSAVATGMKILSGKDAVFQEIVRETMVLYVLFYAGLSIFFTLKNKDKDNK